MFIQVPYYIIFFCYNVKVTVRRKDTLVGDFIWDLSVSSGLVAGFMSMVLRGIPVVSLQLSGWTLCSLYPFSFPSSSSWCWGCWNSLGFVLLLSRLATCWCWTGYCYCWLPAVAEATGCLLPQKLVSVMTCFCSCCWYGWVVSCCFDGLYTPESVDAFLQLKRILKLLTTCSCCWWGFWLPAEADGYLFRKQLLGVAAAAEIARFLLILLRLSLLLPSGVYNAQHLKFRLRKIPYLLWEQ